MTIDDAATVIEEVTEKFGPALEKQVLLAALYDGIPLAGSELLEPWRDVRVIRTSSHAQSSNGAHRSSTPGASRCTASATTRCGTPRQSSTSTSACCTLLAVNRVYWYGFESLESVTRRLPLAPDALLPRLRRAYTAEPEELGAAPRRPRGRDVRPSKPTCRGRRALAPFFRYRRPLWADEQPTCPGRRAAAAPSWPGRARERELRELVGRVRLAELSSTRVLSLLHEHARNSPVAAATGPRLARALRCRSAATTRTAATSRAARRCSSLVAVERDVDDLDDPFAAADVHHVRMPPASERSRTSTVNDARAAASSTVTSSPGETSCGRLLPRRRRS